ncbi:MAG: ATP-dependent 6-phosphofructokinase [candidate division FCPU426 bacterium]
MIKIKHIGVLTSGGDAPGMNAAIRAVVRAATDRKWRVTGILRGYWGLINRETQPMDSRSVGGIINRGGTILRTVRCPEFKQASQRAKAYRHIRELGLEGLVVIGGNGSAAAAQAIHREIQLPVAVVPASIDNDVYGTDDTVGFDTAVNTAVTAIDQIRDTATSHERVFLIEVMGRHNGFIAVEVGLACGAEAVLVPEIKYQLDAISRMLVNGKKRGKLSSIIVMAEGAGDSKKITEQLKAKTGLRVRLSILGYIQRGGSPSARSRLLAARMGHAAVQNLAKGLYAHLSGLQNDHIVASPLAIVTARQKHLGREYYHLSNQLAQ